jgi:hypothetical protein
VLLCCLVAKPGALQAGECPLISGGTARLSEIDAGERLQFIRQRLAREAPRARTWTTAWAVGYGLLTGAQLALVPFFDDEGMQADLVVGAGSSAIGLAALLVVPLEVIDDQAGLEADLNDPRTGPGQCAQLARAENLLIRDAVSEADGVSWLMHGANGVLALGVGLVLGLGFDRWESGAINAAASFAIGEVMILTQPNQLTEDLNRYRQGDLSAGETGAAWFLMPLLASAGGGLQLLVTF